MSQVSSRYCRLCAKTKTKLIHVDSDAGLKRCLIKKLKKLDIDIAAEDDMPKTVCSECTKELDRTVLFLDSVHQAQGTLRLLIKSVSIKKEKSSDTEDQSDHEKFEVPIHSYDSDDEKPIINIKKRHKNDKIKFDSTETWKEYPWLCYKCNLKLPDIDTLRQHSLQIHKQCCKYKCADCDKRKIFSNHIKFLNHARGHRNHLSCCCFVCNVKLDTEDDLKTHALDHQSAFLCKICGVIFDDLYFYEDHVKVKKKKRNANHEINCKYCEKTFLCKSNLQVHLSTHTARTRDFVCHLCGKSYFNKGALAAHLDSHEDKRSFKCEICGHMFRTNAQLRLHVGIHGGVKPYSCEQCGRQFRLRSHLKSHLIIHTDSMPFVCTYCGKCFRFKTILTQHVRQHTGHKPYSCPPCSKEFTNWPNYNKHMKRRHGIDTSKKKHTPDGIFPVNPATGEIQLPTNLPIETEKWKTEILTHRKPGRPRMKLKREDEGMIEGVNEGVNEMGLAETKVEGMKDEID